MPLDAFSAWPAIVLLAGLWALAATPLFKAADSPPIPSDQRVSSLDGLRGFLALSVFLHHLGIYDGFLRSGVWRPPQDRLYALLGPFGVAIFFMITGFLFWSQFIDRSGRPSLTRLYVGRLFRIGPLYVVAALVLCAVAFTATGFTLREPPARVGYEVLRWLGSLGAVMGPDINGFAQTKILLSVTWSLAYEWAFYASLALTGLFTRSRLGAWLFPAIGLVASLAAALTLKLGDAPFVALFCVGMLTAALRPLAARLKPDRWPFSLLAAGLLLIVLVSFRTAYAPLPVLLLGAAFFLIANGTSLFGLLTTRAARRLGNVSFGIYLLQIFILAGAFAVPAARSAALASPLGHWTVGAIAAVVLVAVATATHALIERPGVDLGRKLLSRTSGQMRPGLARA
jgi:peptidoglycan/LPS O-acetylase OafA/YrhL